MSSIKYLFVILLWNCVLLMPGRVFGGGNANGGAPSGYTLKAGRDFAADHVLIKLKSEIRLELAGGNRLLTADAGINEVLRSHGVASLEAVFSSPKPLVTPMSASSTAGNGLNRWLKAKLVEGYDAQTTANELRGETTVEWADVDPIWRLSDGVADLSGAGSVQGNARPSGMSGGVITDKDPLMASQWHLEAIRVKEAWAHLKSLGLPEGGRRDVIVAVIDTGVDYTHPDLAGNIWTNSREIAGNGLDDDNDGYVDDLHGANVGGAHSGDPMDDAGHGTHVAGIIAAQAGNFRGGVGVAPNVQIMPVKANIAKTGGFYGSDVAEAVQYAVAHGADVINLSLGGYSTVKLTDEVMEMAGKQAVIVAAAGNDNKPNLPHPDGANMYPASFPFVLGVMASDKTGGKAGFSNWDYIAYDDSNYEVMAPGAGIWSTIPGNEYGAWDGTSMAAPVAAGIAALVRSKYASKEQYPPGFIHGQIAATAITAGNWKRVDALQAVTGIAQPLLKATDQRYFDPSALSAANDNDGIADAGETIDMAVMVRNYAADADMVTARLDAANDAGFSDPYISIQLGTVDYGGIGSQATDDNGLIRGSDGSIQGVRSPFRFLVSPNCPNDHVVAFRLILNYRSALDAQGVPSLWSTNTFTLRVQNGTELPRIITEDMTLTRDRLWIIPTQTLIPYGVTVTVAPGARIQCGSDKMLRPEYSQLSPGFLIEGAMRAEGTLEEPIEIYAYSMMPAMMKLNNKYGYLGLKYVRITDPFISASSIDHCYFKMNASGLGYRQASSYWHAGPISASIMKNNIFDNLGLFCDWFVDLNGYEISNNLFDSCIFRIDTGFPIKWHGNAFIKSYKSNNRDYQVSAFKPSQGVFWDNLIVPLFATNAVVNGEMKTYFLMPAGSWAYGVQNGVTDMYDVLERYAQLLGGHLADITSAEENQFIRNYMKTVIQDVFTQKYLPIYANTFNNGVVWDNYKGDVNIGLCDKNRNGIYAWTSGAAFTYTNWMGGGGFDARRDGAYWIYFHDGMWGNGDNKKACLLEVPGSISQEQLTASNTIILARAIEADKQNNHNAFLNVLWDVNKYPIAYSQQPDLRWMHIYADGRDRVAFMNNNWWGTVSRETIDWIIVDGKDSLDYGSIVYEPLLESPPADCYPFVADVVISTATEPSTLTVGPEMVNFRVVFNRDMDMGVQPRVTFGPAEPFTDFAVQGNWQDPRTWAGHFAVTPLTGDGYQMMSIVGAVAADDPWLVTGHDSERFRFLVRSAGTESMNLQAVGADNGINLSWKQDDFELLAGYNLYRSLNPTNGFERINRFILPASQHTYSDSTSTTGARCYYKFTVVKTDLTESDYSNTADAISADSIPPVIRHVPLKQTPLGAPLMISAEITDNNAIKVANVYWRVSGDTNYNKIAMAAAGLNLYQATIDGSLVVMPSMEYCIEAYDGATSSWSRPPASPHVVAVIDQPVIVSLNPAKGPSAGGAMVEIAGANFKPGMTVSFGGTLCNSVVVLNDHKAQAVLPPHFPATVDVMVQNPSGQSSVFLRGFQYASDGVVLTMPQVRLSSAASTPVLLASGYVSGLVSADLSLTYDPGQFQILGVRLGALLSGWSLAVNTNVPGKVKMSLASSGPAVDGEGVWLELECQAVESGGATSLFSFDSAVVNGGAVTVQAGSGQPPPTWHVSGKVRYWNGNAPVPNVEIVMHGDGLASGSTDAAGSYDMGGVYSGAYRMEARKTDQANGITAYDAALVLQQAVGLITLPEYAAQAGDVDKNGQINSMDAYYILQKAVGLLELPFPGAGVVWDFTPGGKPLNIGENMGDQDMTAVLLGDVSGNWSAGGTRAYGAASQGAEVIAPMRKPSSISGVAKEGGGVVLSVCPVPGTRAAKILYRADEPIHSVDIRIQGLSAIRCSLNKALAASKKEAGGVICAGVAAAGPLQGAGELFEGAMTGDAPVLLEAFVNEGTAGVRVEAGPESFLGDSDKDGQSDWHEILAGTDPADADSFLKVLGYEMTGHGRKISWSSVPGRSYQLEMRTALGGGQWNPVGPPVTASGVIAQAMDDSDEGQLHFYRVSVVISGSNLDKE